MNNNRRKQISKAKLLLNDALNILEDVYNEEENSYENLSEGLQCTMRGEQMENNISELEEIIDYINDSLENIDNIE